MKKLFITAAAAIAAMALGSPALAGMDAEWDADSKERMQETNDNHYFCNELKSQVNFQTGYPDVGYAVRDGYAQSYAGDKGKFYNCWIGKRAVLGHEYTLMSRKLPDQIYSKQMYKIENNILMQYRKLFTQDGREILMKNAIGFSCPLDYSSAIRPTGFNSVPATGRRGDDYATCNSTGRRFYMGAKPSMSQTQMGLYRNKTNFHTQILVESDFTDEQIRAAGR